MPEPMNPRASEPIFNRILDEMDRCVAPIWASDPDAAAGQQKRMPMPDSLIRVNGVPTDRASCVGGFSSTAGHPPRYLR